MREENGQGGKSFAFLWRQREEIKQLIFRQTRQTAPLISASSAHKRIKCYMKNTFRQQRQVSIHLSPTLASTSKVRWGLDYIRVLKKWKWANNGGKLKVIWNKHIWLKMFQELPVSCPVINRCLQRWFLNNIEETLSFDTDSWCNVPYSHFDIFSMKLQLIYGNFVAPYGAEATRALFLDIPQCLPSHRLKYWYLFINPIYLSSMPIFLSNPPRK